MEELFSAHAEVSALAEANAFRTVPTNYYKAQGTKHEAKRNGVGRLSINAKADLFREDKRIGTISVFLSPEVGRTKTGRLDNEFRLYSQLARSLYPEIKDDASLSQISAGDLMTRFEQYPVGMFVTETFQTDIDPITGKKTYFDAKTDDEAKGYRQQGLKPANYVKSIGKYKV
jgi:hypothetical protein